MQTTKAKRIPRRITITEANLPNYEGTAVTIVGNRILFVEAMNDQDCPNPCEDQDGMGSIRSLSNRHINNIDYDEAKELLESDKDVIPLSYFEHGNSLWMVAGSAMERTPGIEFQWDGVRFAGIWIPDASVRESFAPSAENPEKDSDGLTRHEWMAKQAEICCEEYSKWANGDCWGFDIQVYKVRKDDDGEPYDQKDDYRRDEAEYDESCFGFVGHDYFESEIKDQALYALKDIYQKQGFSKRAIATAFKKP